VSKKGAVTLSLLPNSAKDGPSMKTLSGGKTGVELEAFRAQMQDKFKGNSSALIGRITASKEWNPKSITMNPTGDRVSFVFEREEPETLVTEADALKSIAKARGITVEQLMVALSLVEPTEPESKPENNGQATIAKPAAE
jgi:hypothetical protein